MVDETRAAHADLAARAAFAADGERITETRGVIARYLEPSPHDGPAQRHAHSLKTAAKLAAAAADDLVEVG